MKKGGGTGPAKPWQPPLLWKRCQIQSVSAEKISWIDLLVPFFIGAIRNSNSENEQNTRHTQE